VAQRKVGQIGLGHMGGGVARNILKADYRLVVHDLRPEPVEELVALGATAGGSGRGVARECDLVLLCLHAPQVEDAIFGEDGLIHDLAPGGLLVDLGNCHPWQTRRIGARVREAGRRFMDAAISGGPEGAWAGTVAILAGGERADFEEAKPIFEAFGGVITYFGELGNGHAAKIVNNLIVAITTMTISEALTFGEDYGLDMNDLLGAITTGAARSWILDHAGTLFQEPVEGRERRLMPRGGNQLTWALEIATESGLPMPLTALASQLRNMGPEEPRMLELMGQLFAQFTQHRT